MGMNGTTDARALSASLQDALAAAGARASRAGRPLLIVFADTRFGRIIDNWRRHIDAVGAGPFLVLALDDTLESRLRGEGVAVARAEFDGSTYDLWVRRSVIFAHLAASGIDFVHSDADAIWHRDVQPSLLADGQDLVFSQGTILPRDALDRWGFVLCCGLFAVRASPASARFLAAASLRTAALRDDQLAINQILAEADIAWQRADMARRWVRYGGARFEIHDRVLHGEAASMGLRIALLPHAEYPRLPLPRSPGVAVSHPLTPAEAGAKEAALRALGLWREEGA